MSFVSDLHEQIHRFLGLDPIVEGDTSFFQPGGNDHFIQFFLQSYPLEYLELEPWDRHNLFLQDLAMEQGLEFTLEEAGDLAYLIQTDERGVQVVRALMVLRQESLGLMYLIGEPRHCQRLLTQVTQSKWVHPCYLASRFLMDQAKHFVDLDEMAYHFEQLYGTHQHRQALKGLIQGQKTESLMQHFSQNFEELFNLISFSGHSSDGSLGKVSLSEAGLLHAEALKLSNFLEATRAIYDHLTTRYQGVRETHLLHVQSPGQGLLEVQGQPVCLRFLQPLDMVEGLLRQLTSGIKPLFLLGTAERLSRGVWSIYATEVATGKQLKMELSREEIRFFLANAHSIPLMERVEQHLAKSVSRLI